MKQKQKKVRVPQTVKGQAEFYHLCERTVKTYRALGAPLHNVGLMPEWLAVHNRGSDAAFDRACELKRQQEEMNGISPPVYRPSVAPAAVEAPPPPPQPSKPAAPETFEEWFARHPTYVHHANGKQGDWYEFARFMWRAEVRGDLTPT